MKHIFDDADKNKYEAYTKQEVLEVIQEAISSGELPEEINGLVLTFKNPVDNQAYKIAFCTQAKYNELQSGGQLEANCYYFITDDSSYDDLDNAISNLQTQIEKNTNDISVLDENKTDKRSVSELKSILIENKDGVLTIYSSDEDSGDTISLKFDTSTVQLIYIPDIGTTKTYNLKTYLDKVDVLESKHLYRHDMQFYTGPEKAVYFSLYLSTNEILTNVTLANYMENYKDISATGFYKSVPNADPVFIISIYKSGTNWYIRTLNNVGISISNTSSVDSAFSDNVTQIL